MRAVKHFALFSLLLFSLAQFWQPPKLIRFFLFFSPLCTIVKWLDLCLAIPLCLFQAFMRSFASLCNIYCCSVKHFSTFFFRSFTRSLGIFLTLYWCSYIFTVMAVELPWNSFRYSWLPFFSVVFCCCCCPGTKMNRVNCNCMKIEQINHLEIFITELRSNLVHRPNKRTISSTVKDIANAQTFVRRKSKQQEAKRFCYTFNVL